MKVKRLYDEKELAAWREDNTRDRPRVVGIRVLQASQWQNISPNLVDIGIVEGWLAKTDDTITFLGDEGCSFQVVREPGRWCCHCDEKLPDEPPFAPNQGAMAREHVATHHPGIDSPDAQNAAGYRMNNFFRCLLIGDDIDVLTVDEARALDNKVRESLAAASLKHLPSEAPNG